MDIMKSQLKSTTQLSVLCVSLCCRVPGTYANTFAAPLSTSDPLYPQCTPVPLFPWYVPLYPQCTPVPLGCSSVLSMYLCPLGMFLCTLNVPLSPWDVPLYSQCTPVSLGCSSVLSMYPFSLGMFLCTLNVTLSPWGVPSMFYPSQFLCDLVFLRTLWGVPL